MFTCFIFASRISHAYIAGAQTITVDGRLFTSPTSDSPLLDASVVVNVKILAADSSCILYEEKQTIDTSQTDGRFTLNIGSLTGASKRTGADVNNPMVSIFQNNSAIAGSCGSYTPAVGDVRYVRITVAPSTTGTVEVLSPDTIIDAVPNALVAETLQGLDRDHVLAIDPTSTLSQTNVANIFSSTNYPVLTSLLGGTSSSYVTSSANGAKIPTVSGVPASLATGQIWFNSSANAFQYYNGSAVQTLGIAGSGLSALTVGSNLTANGTAGGTLNSSGTIDLANNATAGTYTKVSVNSKGLVTYGSGLSESDIPTLSSAGHVIGDAITSGTIGGSTAFYSSGNVTTTGTVSGTYITSNTDTTRAIRLFDPAAGSTNKITLTAPTLTADYALVFPNSAGVAGSVLTTDGSGNLSWTSASAGSVTSVGLSLPPIFTVTNPVVTSTGTLSATLASQSANLIFAGPASGSASSPTFRALTAADLPVGGYDSTYLKPALALGKIWVGSSAGVATPVTPTGDLTLTPSGLFTVTALQGSAVDPTAPSAAGQVLRWTSGSKWSPAYLSMQDIHSTVTVGNTIFPVTACTADKTLTWTSLTDTFTCQSIAISDSQITYSSRAAGLIFAGPATGSAAAPTFRSIASTDLPANAYDSTYFKQGGNTFGTSTVLGTSDSNTLTIKTNNVARETFGTDGRIGVGTATPTAGALVEYFGTGTSQSALLLPRDSTANRPTGVNGMIRYNNVLNKLEVFENNGWTNYASSSVAAASGVVGAIQFSGGSGAFSSDASNLFYDSTNRRLGVGTATPLYPLDIVGTGHFSGALSSAVVYATLGESHFANTGYADPVVGTAFDVKIGGTNSLAVRGNAVFISPVGVGTATAAAMLDVYSTGTNSALIVPRASAAARPTGTNGMIRYNTDSNVLESFIGGTWSSLATAAVSGGYLPLAGGTMTGSIVNINGSSNTPSLAFADSTTGFYSTGSGNISAATGGTARMTIGSSGNVAIGTTTSNARLVVAGTDTSSVTSAFSVLNSSATNLLNVYDNGSVAIGGGSFNSSRSLTVNGGIQVATGPLQISAAGPSSANTGSFSFTDSTGNLNYSSNGGTQGHITFNPSGLVGIGTTTPASLLNVNGNIQAGGTVGNLSAYLGSASGASALGYSTGYLGFNASRTSGNWSLASDGAHNGGNAIFSTINGYLYLAALPNSGTSTTAQTLTDAQVMANVAVTVAPNGLVGIGNQNPAALLDLASSGTNSALIVPRASTAMRPTSVNGMIRYNTDNSALESYIAGSWVNLSTSAAGGGASQWTTSGSNIYYASGNVGIGTSTTPFKLTLGGDGGVLASGVYGTGASLGTLGANTSMIWYPRKASFRAGIATGSAFDDGNIGSYSIAAGSDVIASGNNSTAFGGLNSATGTGATAIGFSNAASNQYATAIGGGNSASGTGATSIGYYTNSPAYGETAVGQFNATTGSETANSIVSTDPVFVVGNGTSSSARSTALTVLHNGYLGVGVASPSTVMQIHDPLTATPGGIVIDASSSGGVNSPRIGFIDTALGTTSSAPVWFFDQSADKFRVFRQPNISTVGAAFFTISNAGKVGIGTATANAQLDIYGVGTSASAMLVPRDSSANRPAGVNGMIRYNTDLGAIEMYGSGAWSSFATSTGATGAFLNGGNSFGAAANLGTNDSNVLNFRTNGSTRAVIDASGNFGIGTTSPGAPFQIGSSGATGSVRYVSNGANSYFGIYDSGNSLYYGLGTTLPSPSGTATIAGYYKGLGIGGSTNGAGNPIFGVLTSSQSGSGVGSTSFTVKDTNEIDTYYNVLDNGNGSMGIGTTTATNKLNVWGSANYGIVEIVGNGTNVESSIGFRSSNISKGANAGEWVLGANTNGQSANSFGLYSGGTNSTVLTILSSGNVGIGTTSPVNPLQVSGTALFGYTSANQLNVTIGAGGPANTRNLALYYTSGGTNGSVTGDYSVIQSGYSGIGYSPIALSPAGGGVGIGTTAPSGQLHVNLSTSGSSILQTLTNSGNGSNITIDSAGSSGAYFPTAVVGDSVIRAETNSLELGVTSASGHIALGNTSSEWMRISSSGNVGIGSSNPGQKLSVGGTIESTSGGVKFPDGTTQTTAAGGAIAMRYYAGSATTSIPAGAFSGAITFDTKVYDTANAFNGTKFTAPVAGIYNICASAIANAAPTNWELDLYRNGSRDHAFMLSPSGTAVTGCTMTQLAAGDYVDIRTFQSNAQTIQVSNLWTWIAITKM